MKPFWKVGVAVAGLVAIAAVTAVILFWSRIDPGLESGVRIENRTDIRLMVFSVLADGTRVPVADLAPGEAGESPGPCIRGHPLVAESTDGEVVARYGPFDGCGEGPWIIRSGP